MVLHGLVVEYRIPDLSDLEASGLTLIGPYIGVSFDKTVQSPSPVQVNSQKNMDLCCCSTTEMLLKTT